MSKKIKKSAKTDQKMDELLDKKPEFFKLPKIGENAEGRVIEVRKKEILVSLPGIGVGVVRGPELPDRNFPVKTGSKVLVTVLELENEAGILELSLRRAGRDLAWKKIKTWLEEGEIVDVKVNQANKGGLIADVAGVPGFLPVSQLTPANYPRVEGGDRSEIVKRLNLLVGKELRVKVIDADEEDDKLIISERAAALEDDKEKLSDLKVGAKIKGEVSGLADFGVFVKFDGLEGLVHVSELAWQRVDDPRDLYSVGNKIEAEIISVSGGRISLSVKNLLEDPWLTKAKDYKVGDSLEGEVVKISPFGAFIKLDDDIHGLLHVSELTSEEEDRPLSVGDKRKFKIISVEPEEHRLGLSLKGVKQIL